MWHKKEILLLLLRLQNNQPTQPNHQYSHDQSSWEEKSKEEKKAFFSNPQSDVAWLGKNSLLGGRSWGRPWSHRSHYCFFFSLSSFVFFQLRKKKVLPNQPHLCELPWPCVWLPRTKEMNKRNPVVQTWLPRNEYCSLKKKKLDLLIKKKKFLCRRTKIPCVPPILSFRSFPLPKSAQKCIISWLVFYQEPTRSWNAMGYCCCWAPTSNNKSCRGYPSAIFLGECAVSSLSKIAPPHSHSLIVFQQRLFLFGKKKEASLFVYSHLET